MDFKKITINDKGIIESYTKNWVIENNDLSFTTLYLWGKHGKIMYAEQDGALFFHYDFPDNPQFFLPPVTKNPNGDYKAAVDAAIREMRSMGIAPCFRSAAAPFLDPLKESICNAVITPTPFNNDYVYLAESLITLKGKKLHSKRNHINSFLAEHSDWEYVSIDENNFDECMALYEQWSEGKTEPTLEEYDERLTVELAIKHMHELGLFGGGIRLGGRLCAFSVGECTTSDMVTVHIEKADASINGLFPLINQQFVLHESRGASFINREDDMGIDGLRRAKQSYQPCRMIEKYMLTLAED